MAKLRVKAPDGKTLVVAVPDGTDPSQYDSLASAALAHYQDGAVMRNGENIEPGVYGDTDPVEQRVLENATKVGNAAGLTYGIPGIVKGLAGLGMRAAGAIGKGLLAPTAEKIAPWFGSRVLGFARSTLPGDAIKADGVIDAATDYAMKPHPEIQQAIMDIKGLKGAEDLGDAASTGTGMVPASESTVKAPPEALESGTKELPPGNASLEGGKDISTEPAPEGDAAEGEVMPEASAEAPAEEPEMENLEHLNEPIITPTGSTKDMLATTDKHISTVGGAIEDTLNKLNSTGQQFDPAPVAKELEGMYMKDAAGKIIKPGADSAQAANNAAVDYAIRTLKAEAQDGENGVMQKLPWTTANRIKGLLQQMADQSPVYEHAGAVVKEGIDNQAQEALGSQGGNVQAFQALRNAYSNLKNIRRTLNNNALGQMGAKNAFPVVRSMAAMGGVATGNPGVAAAAGADFVGRRYASQMMAAGLRNMPEAAEGVSNAGNAMTAGQGAPAARSIANGLMAVAGDDR